MARTTLVLGAVLVALGVVGYVVSGFASWTALIPAILGVAIVACGLVGRSRPKLGIHAALAVAILGALGTLRNVVALPDVFSGDAARPLAVVVSTITFVLLVGYVVLGVRSFVAARRPASHVP